MKGLSSGGGLWHDSSPTGILQGRVPGYMQDLFEAQLNGQGLGLRNLAVLTSTLEHLVHDDAVEGLKAAYSLGNVSMASGSPEDQVVEVVENFLLAFVLGLLSRERVDGQRQPGGSGRRGGGELL